MSPYHNIWVISDTKDLFSWAPSGLLGVERGFLLHSFCQLHWSCCTGSVNMVLWPSRISRRARRCLETFFFLRDITVLTSTYSAETRLKGAVSAVDTDLSYLSWWTRLWSSTWSWLRAVVSGCRVRHLLCVLEWLQQYWKYSHNREPSQSHSLPVPNHTLNSLPPRFYNVQK